MAAGTGPFLPSSSLRTALLFTPQILSPSLTGGWGADGQPAGDGHQLALQGTLGLQQLWGPQRSLCSGGEGTAYVLWGPFGHSTSH